MELVGAVATNPDKEGADLGAITIGEANGIEVTCDLDSVLAERPDVVIHTGLGSGSEVAEVLGRCVDRGVDAITVNGLVEPVAALGADEARRLDERAVSGGGRIVGTGVNPGYLVDALPSFWGGMVSRIDKVWARRVSEVRYWGDGVLDDEIGIGVPPDKVDITRALAVDSSAAQIALALSLEVERQEDINERVPAPADRVVGERKVAKGETVGFRHRTLAYRGDQVVVEVEWLGVFGLDPEVDGAEESAELRIEGDVDVAASCSGTFFGDPYPSTAARALNAVEPLRSMAPGLYRTDQIPQSGKFS